MNVWLVIYTKKKSWEVLNIIHMTDKLRPLCSLQEVFKGSPHFLHTIFITIDTSCLQIFTLLIQDLLWHLGRGCAMNSSGYRHTNSPV